MALEEPVLYDVAASNAPITPEMFVDRASVIEYGVKLPVLFPKVKALEGLLLKDVATSEMFMTLEVFAEEVSVVEYAVTLSTPGPRNVGLVGPVPLILEDVAASDGTATPGRVVDWLAGIGNGGDREVDTPTTCVEALLTVIARR